MVFPTLLPRVDESTSTQLLSALARIGPLLVNPSNARSIAERLDLDAEWFVECDTVEQVEDALNGPAGKVIVGEEVIGSIGDEFKRDVIVRLSTIQGKEDQLDGLAGVVLPSSSSIDATQIKSIRKRLVAPGLILIESETTTTTTPSADLIPLIPSSSLTPESIAKLFISNLTSDRPDGLYPTIVSTPSSSPSPALGLVYSSGESITESIITGKGVYQSRKHGLWRKGETSGSTQKVIRIRKDCDQDALVFEVEQTGTGFCHLETRGCFSLDAGRTDEKRGLEALEQTLRSRLTDAPPGSYTSRLFNDPKLLSQKIMEEAEELVDAADSDRSHVAFEMADLLYFAMVKCVKAGVSLKDVERNLDEKAAKGKKGIRRTGDAKSKWVEYGRAKEEQAAAGKAGDKILGVQTVETVGKDEVDEVPVEQVVKAESKPDAPVPKAFPTSADDGAAVANGDAQAEMIRMRTSDLGSVSREERQELLKRPVMDSSAMIERVKPIVSKVREGGDQALKALTKQFDRSDLDSNVLLPPFYPPPGGQELSTKITDAIEQAYANVKAFHEGQAEKEPLVVETMPGVVCTRFARPIDRVGIYVPGGTAILPSTALMLGVPAQVAGCSTIVLATPPRPDGSISPEVLYVAKLVGVDVILKAGGAQAVAAMAYGTETCPKVDKIFGPGNQWVTAAKMLVQNDTQALVGIDMPAGPSEVMVIADKTANPVFVASDLLSQAEHGIDSQVVLVAIDLSTELLESIEQEVDKQANALPRVDIIRQAIKKSLIVTVRDIEEAFKFSNEYAPEHLILHLEKSSDSVKLVNNAGSVFVGAFSPESCGDYASGTNHTLPTYGYAKQFSGVNTLSFQKHITSQELTEDGLRALGPIVVTLAECEGLEAHANAVRVRLATLQ